MWSTFTVGPAQGFEKKKIKGGDWSTLLTLNKMFIQVQANIGVITTPAAIARLQHHLSNFLVYHDRTGSSMIKIVP